MIEVQSHLDLPHHAGLLAGDGRAKGRSHCDNGLECGAFARRHTHSLLRGFAKAKDRDVHSSCGKRGWKVRCPGELHVAPATTLTERVVGLMSDERRAEIAHLTPLGKLGDPRDSAYATLYLCSDAASWITGITIDVAGGRIML